MKLKHAAKELDLGLARVMGILNMTPDSFSDGGRFNQLDSALRHAEQMIADGAHIIDVGGESTRPGAPEVSAQEELDRVVPVVEAIASRFDTWVSVDTSEPLVMQAVIAAGADLLNDVRSFSRDGALSIAAASGLPVCIMHMIGDPRTMQNNPRYDDPVGQVYDFLENRLKDCVAAGIPAERVLIDPGFGFGKTLDHNLLLLKQLERFGRLGCPVLAGMSRKTMIGQILNAEVGERVTGSVAAAVIAAQNGARILRVHDVRETAQALAVFNAQLSA